MEIVESLNGKRAIVSFACEIYPIIEHNKFEERNGTIIEVNNSNKIYYGENKNSIGDYLTNDVIQYIANYLLQISAKGPIDVRRNGNNTIIAEFAPIRTDVEIFDDVTFQRDLLCESEYHNPASKFVIAMGGLIYSRIDITESSISVNIVDEIKNNESVPVAEPLLMVTNDCTVGAVPIPMIANDCTVGAEPMPMIAENNCVVGTESIKIINSNNENNSTLLLHNVSPGSMQPLIISENNTIVEANNSPHVYYHNGNTFTSYPNGGGFMTLVGVSQSGSQIVLNEAENTPTAVFSNHTNMQIHGNYSPYAPSFYTTINGMPGYSYYH